MRTAVVLIFLMIVFAVGTALIIEPRWVLTKLVSPVRRFAVRARHTVARRERGRV